MRSPVIHQPETGKLWFEWPRLQGIIQISWHSSLIRTSDDEGSVVSSLSVPFLVLYWWLWIVIKCNVSQFLADEWQDSSYVVIIKKCVKSSWTLWGMYRFKVEDGVVHRSPVDALCNNHEEADTKICLHALFEDITHWQCTDSALPLQ